MKSGVGGLLFLLVATAGQFLPQGALKEPPRVPPEKIPAPEWSHPVGYPPSSAALLELDQQVANYGIAGRYFRNVAYVDSSGEPIPDAVRMVPSLGTSAAVNYRIGREEGLGSGVMVWINTWTGETLIVPKEVLRAADRVVLRAGIDLALLSRVAEKVGKRIHMKYHYRGFDDGVFVVKVEPHTAKADQKIYWWDGRIGRAHYP